ncbi:hypothetical protein IMCC3317_09420 [Kordia antarctica]|uniref:Uncharacterized protein n=1 Tax=Kordia antarctica TaxID=1218801 RepID=A0A7L4ZH93_9FLAO|nr:hypothetical protein IMCC3317_09420 [Kordia antarctica]
MAKNYTTSSSEMKILFPKTETINFLLNYSKALSVINYKRMKFETLLN